MGGYKMKDFNYAKEQEQKCHKKKWYILDLAEYSCFILFTPLIPFVWAYDKWKEYLWESCQWSEKKASKVLDYVLPYYLDYNKERDDYYYCSRWNYTGWKFAKHVPISLKTFTRKYIREIKDYLFNEYQKDGYKKWIEKPDFVFFKKIS